MAGRAQRAGAGQEGPGRTAKSSSKSNSSGRARPERRPLPPEKGLLSKRNLERPGINFREKQICRYQISLAEKIWNSDFGILKHERRVGLTKTRGRRRPGRPGPRPTYPVSGANRVGGASAYMRLGPTKPASSALLGSGSLGVAELKQMLQFKFC